MITIDSINVDVARSMDELMAEWAVFAVEFEYNNKIIIGHTYGASVYRGVRTIIDYALNRKMGNLELRQALLKSKYITVDVLCSLKDFFSENLISLPKEKRSVVLAKKYKFIKEYKSYYPYGYNILTEIGYKKEELEYVHELYNELANEIDASALFVPDNLKLMSKGRPGKLVHKFNAITGLYLETYNSLKEAAIATNANSSNISACCSDLTGKKTAGGFKWSYDKDVIFTN